jgi:hypothetical protein
VIEPRRMLRAHLMVWRAALTALSGDDVNDLPVLPLLVSAADSAGPRSSTGQGADHRRIRRVVHAHGDQIGIAYLRPKTFASCCATKPSLPPTSTSATTAPSEPANAHLHH